jgi:hypothetical protein
MHEHLTAFARSLDGDLPGSESSASLALPADRATYAAFEAYAHSAELHLLPRRPDFAHFRLVCFGDDLFRALYASAQRRGGGW